ncbi:MAG: response regulator [Chitinophagales bacterium]
MRVVKIGIVEDEMIIAEVLAMTLRKLGYTICFQASSFASAIASVADHQPDLVILDINLGEQKDGIDVARYLRHQSATPIIFLTANSDKSTLARTKEVKPEAYLVKPFTKEQLYAAIELALDHSAVGPEKRADILVKDGYTYIKVRVKEIVYITSEQNYVALHLQANKKVLVRNTLSQMLEQLDQQKFVRISRGIAVNIDFVTSLQAHQVLLGSHTFPVNKIHREALLAMINQRL